MWKIERVYGMRDGAGEVRAVLSMNDVKPGEYSLVRIDDNTMDIIYWSNKK